MKRIKVLFFFISLPVISWCQLDAAIELDSLKISFKTGGELNSVDLISSGFSNSFTPNQFNRQFQFIQADHFFAPERGIFISNPKVDNRLIFTALPHIGFSYVFGSQGTQLLNFNYQQAFKYDFILNAAIKRNQSAGFLRNSNLQNNQYDLKLAKIGKRYSFLFSGIYANESNAWNGGVLVDTLATNFPPGLLSIVKENAQSNVNNSVLNLKNQFRITGDSVNFIRLQLVNQYSNQKRFYSENDSLSLIYPMITIDSLNTNDTLNTNRFNNNLSVLFKKSGLIFEAGANYDYWNYQAFEMKRDTSEIGIFEQLSFAWKKIKINHQGQLNLVGAGRGFSSKSVVSIPFLKGTLEMNHELNYCYPTLFQRHFYSNNSVYHLANLELQKRQQFQLKLKDINANKGFNVHYQLINYKDNYFFDSFQQTWRNDLNLSTGILHQVLIEKPFKVKQFYFSPRYVFNGMKEEFRVIPTHQFNARLFFQGGIFKAKKLKFASGFDIALNSKFKSAAYIPQLNLLYLINSSTGIYQNTLLNVAFFSSFEVETFHFFVRADNFAYFWSNKTTAVIQGYTLPNLQVKIGITWDFWN